MFSIGDPEYPLHLLFNPGKTGPEKM
jgi:hypothetical protein